MKSFCRLNILSSLYGFSFFMFHALYVYQELIISKIPLPKNMSLSILTVGVIFLFALSMYLVFYVTNKWLIGNIRFFTIILWFPYYLLLNYFLFSTVLQDIPPQFELSPGSGFIVLFAVGLYPMLIGTMNVISGNTDMAPYSRT
ncbi:hypothetical protein [Paenisporosarcina cavernae]|uniref:Uncharacterized protein n=1 Tax=Paenisporosarcina cavernae TaxID=2320858 RepID=A0A385YXI0_9BACL|nr:hypothetical protein [Paenisporosarcina cavernae]AYC30283.1 hypothetical protein D3873_10635 [Paenisporosarcina cavernae]